MTRADRERAQRAENRRLKAALSAIHDALHADAVDRAHELCECALAGEEVTQPNLSASNSATAMSFAADFNKLTARARISACCVMLLPSSTFPGAVSIQLGGEVQACKIIERMLRGAESVYMGDRADGATEAAT